MRIFEYTQLVQMAAFMQNRSFEFFRPLMGRKLYQEAFNKYPLTGLSRPIVLQSNDLNVVNPFANPGNVSPRQAMMLVSGKNA